MGRTSSSNSWPVIHQPKSGSKTREDLRVYLVFEITSPSSSVK